MKSEKGHFDVVAAHAEKSSMGVNTNRHLDYSQTKFSERRSIFGILPVRKVFAVAVAIICLTTLESRSQTSETKCLHYPYNTQVGMNLNVNLLSKMKIEHNKTFKPSEDFRSYPSFGADLGVYMYQRVYKWFGIQIGAEYSALTLRYSTTTNLTDDVSTYMDYYAFGAFTLPVLLNASYYFNEKHGIDISLGGAPLVLFAGDAGQGVEFGSGNGKCYFRLENDTRCNYSLYAKIGYNYLFKNKNTLGVAIIGSYAAEPYAKGTYTTGKGEMTGDGNFSLIVDSGYTSLRNTFIGLQFSYGITMKKLLCTQ